MLIVRNCWYLFAMGSRKYTEILVSVGKYMYKNTVIVRKYM